MEFPLHIIVREALSSDERNQVYRLRYETLAKELGDDKWANHSDGVCVDPADAAPHRLVVAVTNNGEVMGSMRLHFGPQIMLPENERIPLPELAMVLGCDEKQVLSQMVYACRAAVKIEYRKQKVFHRIMEHCISLCVQADMPVICGAVASTNHASQSALRCTGFEMLPKSYVDDGREYFTFYRLTRKYP